MRLIFFTVLLLLAPTGFAQTDPDADPQAALEAFFGEPAASDELGLDSEPEFLPVQEAYRLNLELAPADSNGQHRLRLNWQIADGYYLYRHGFKTELLTNGEAKTIDAEIPAGREKIDEYFGKVQVYYHNADITVADFAAGSTTLKVTSQGCADAGLCYPPHSEYYRIDTQQGLIQAISAPLPADTASVLTAPTSSSSSGSLFTMLLLALLGGAILNLMPCVFPVLSLKVLAFANDREHSSTGHGLAYTAGVVLSFVLVAAVLVSLQAAGEAIGWGFHLQSPWFVAALAYLFFVMGLSLSGFVEFGGGLMNAGSGLAEKSGYSGSFFTGVLATIVASPCTAPFMGTALGFAVTQPAGIALLVFAALGFGMAVPVLLLSYSPRLLNKIPKPGAWMDTLKQLLAFPLYLTVVWLCWVVGNQTGASGMALLLLGGVLLALACWLWRLQKTLWRALAGLLLAVALSLLTSPLMKASPATTSTAAENWQPYSPNALAALREQGEPVFINITADWCITCLTNEKVTLSSERVQQALRDGGITYLKGDWTNHDPQITALLKRYGRNGIPLYIVYPRGTAERGEVLPQILTTDRVLAAFDRALEG